MIGHILKLAICLHQGADINPSTGGGADLVVSDGSAGEDLNANGMAGGSDHVNQECKFEK